MRIDLLLQEGSRESFLYFFTKSLHAALNEAGASCRLLEAEHDNPKPFLEALFADKPDCTLSFNGLLPNEQGIFLCDLLKIPHLSYLIDSPLRFSLLTQSPFNMIACSDRAACKLFEEQNFNRAFFLPPAVDQELLTAPGSKREYQAVYFGHFIDFEAIAQGWKQRYPGPLAALLEKTAERTLYERGSSSIVHNLIEALNEQDAIDPRTLDYPDILSKLESYIKGRDRIELLDSFQTTKIDLFPCSGEKEEWERQLKGKVAEIHDKVSYLEALEIMKKSQIVLDSSPWIREGVSRRLLSGIACGAAVVTAKTPYLLTQFLDGEGVLYYAATAKKSPENEVQALLTDPKERAKRVETSQKNVLSRHTWSSRAEELLKTLPPLIASMQT